MKLTASNEQIRHFRREGSIELDGLFSDQDLTLIKEKIRWLEDPFLLGYGLHQSYPELKTIFLNRRYAEVAAALLESECLRFAYDQLCPSAKEASDLYAQFLQSEKTLEERSSIQGMLGAFFVALEDRKVGEEGLLPSLAGNALFVSADGPFPALDKEPNQSFMMLAYCKENSRYRFNASDPFTHFWKKSGYGFGDALKSPCHPVLFKR